MTLDKKELYNPWKSFVLDVIDGKTSFSTQDYYDIIRYIDKLVEDNDEYKQELTKTKALAEMYYLISTEKGEKLKLANEQTEYFEREWYLCCDKLDAFNGEV